MRVWCSFAVEPLRWMNSLRRLSSLTRSMSTTANQRPTWSRLIRYIPSGGQTVRLGEPVDAAVDVGLALHEKPQEAIKVHVYSGKSMLDAGQRTGEQDTVGRVLSPLDQAEVGTIRCMLSARVLLQNGILTFDVRTGIGLNYARHAEEASLPIPTEPIVFFKPATSLTGSSPAKIIVPRFVANDTDSADYESELAIILSKDAKDVSEQDAMDYVLGYCASNDVSR